MGFSIDIVTPLINAGQTWFGGLWGRVIEVWNKGIIWVVMWWGVLLTAVGWIYTAWHFATTGLQSAVGYLDHLVMPVVGGPPGGITGIFQIANTFMPLQEIFGMIVSYGALMTAVYGFKITRKALGFLIGV